MNWTPEQAALEIRNFAKDETGIGNIKSAYAALDIIRKHIADAPLPHDKSAIAGTLFWQLLNLSWKESFVPMGIVNRYRLRRFTKSLQRLLAEWK